MRGAMHWGKCPERLWPSLFFVAKCGFFFTCPCAELQYFCLPAMGCVVKLLYQTHSQKKKMLSRTLTPNDSWPVFPRAVGVDGRLNVDRQNTVLFRRSSSRGDDLLLEVPVSGDKIKRATNWASWWLFYFMHWIPWNEDEKRPNWEECRRVTLAQNITKDKVNLITRSYKEIWCIALRNCCLLVSSPAPEVPPLDQSPAHPLTTRTSDLATFLFYKRPYTWKWFLWLWRFIGRNISIRATSLKIFFRPPEFPLCRRNV